MDTIAPLTQASNTLDTFAKYVRVMEKAGVSFDQLTLPINNRAARRNLADFLKAGCPKLNVNGGDIPQELTGYELATTIMGKDFIRPDEVATARGITYSDEELEELESTLPPREELEWLRDNGFMLLPKPPKEKPLNILEVRDLKPDYFYSKTGGWYANDKERFAREERTAHGWLKLRKGAMPNSFNKNWAEQQALVSGLEYVPDSAQVAWGITTYKAVRGVYLLPNVYVRTSSCDSGGRRVGLGDFDAEGLHVVSYWDDSCYSHLGVASARK